jgi:hypothetical protein
MMTSNYQHRLTSASEAWARLFRNARPPIPRHQHTPTASRQFTGNSNIPTGNIRQSRKTQQHQESHTTSQNGTQLNPLSIIQPPLSLRDNVSWGDKIDKQAATPTRIYSQNVNGIRLERMGTIQRNLPHSPRSPG